MTIDLHQLFVLGILTSAIHWLAGRSEIARPLWSRAPGWLDRLLRCPACTGWWLGLLAWFAGVHVWAAPFRAVEVVLNGVTAVFVTPVFEGAILWGLRETAILSDEDRSGSVDPALVESGEVTPRPPQV